MKTKIFETRNLVILSFLVTLQVVLERLGGGGNSNVAGGRVENAEVGAVREKLLASLDEYFEK